MADDDRYWAAKKRRDADAAYSFCEDICANSPESDQLADYCVGGAEPPVVVAPRGSIYDSKNALAIGHGLWVDDDLGWPFSIEI